MKRLYSLVFRFPFYEQLREGSHSRESVEKAREQACHNISKLSFVRQLYVDRTKIREPLFIEIDIRSAKLEGKSVEEIEKGLENLVLKVYDYRKCL